MREIQLTRGNVARVDESDFDSLSAYSWQVNKVLHLCYAQRSEMREDGKWHSVMMHRQIMGAKRGTQVDHIDGDGLNCQRDNLRIATARQNQRNRVHSLDRLKTSQFKGVYWHKKSGKWNARIRAGEVGADGRARTLHLGLFVNERSAARAYDAAALQYFGKFAAVNLQDSMIT